MPTVRQLGIGFIAYSPLGRGYLTGSYRARPPRRGGLAGAGRRASEENLERNLRLADEVRSSRSKRRDSAQLGACVHSRGDDIVPIRDETARYLEEKSIGAAEETELTDDELRRLDEAFPAGVAAGGPLPRHVDGQPVAASWPQAAAMSRPRVSRTVAGIRPRSSTA